MIDARETEVLSWAVKVADAKTRAEAAKAAGNEEAFRQYAADADASRQKLRSLGYPWIADVLSGDGATANQARLYLQSLRQHLDRYDPSNTPPLTMQAALAMSPSTGGLPDLLGGLGSGAQQLSAGARQETVNWLAVVQLGIKITLPVIIIWGFVKSIRLKANLGRG